MAQPPLLSRRGNLLADTSFSGLLGQAPSRRGIRLPQPFFSIWIVLPVQEVSSVSSVFRAAVDSPCEGFCYALIR